MGMYTELVFNAELAEATPKEIIIGLGAIREGNFEPLGETENPFFKKPRWRSVFCCCSFYFTAFSVFHFEKDDISNTWWIGIKSSLKNYDGEIEAFLDWIKPHLAKNYMVLGYYIYEEDGEPTIIYQEGGAVKARRAA